MLVDKYVLNADVAPTTASALTYWGQEGGDFSWFWLQDQVQSLEDLWHCNANVDFAQIQAWVLLFLAALHLQEGPGRHAGERPEVWKEIGSKKIFFLMSFSDLVHPVPELYSKSAHLLVKHYICGSPFFLQYLKP